MRDKSLGLIKKKSLPLRHNIAWVGLGNGIYLGTQWLMLSAIAKLGNSILVGQFSFGLAVVAPAIILSQMQLRQVVVTDTKGEYFYSDYFWTRVIFTIIAVFGVSLITMFMHYSFDMYIIICLIALAKGFESISDILYAKLQKHDRMDFISISMIIKGIVSLALFSFILWLSKSLVFALVGLTFSWVAILFLLDLNIFNNLIGADKIIRSWRPLVTRRLFLASLPLAFTAGLISLSLNIPRYFLEIYCGYDAVAIYSVACAPLAFITLFSGSISQAVMARMSRYFQDQKYDEFLALTLKITILVFLVSVFFTSIFVLFGDLLISILFTSEYAGAVPILVIMSTSLIVGSFATFGINIIIAGRYFKMQLLNIIVAIAIQIPLCYYLILGYGSMGAGWAEFIKAVGAMIFLNLAGFWVAKKQMIREGSTYGHA